MRSLTLLVLAACAGPLDGATAQVPLAVSHAALRGAAAVSNHGGPRLSELRFVDGASWRPRTTGPNPAITASLGRANDVELLDDQARGGARIGTVLGWVVGMTAGPALFAGNDMGCNKYGECFGRMRSGDAVLAGALVMGAAGFLSGTILGAVQAPDWCGDIPWDGLGLGFAPDGKPGVKMMAEIRF